MSVKLETLSPYDSNSSTLFYFTSLSLNGFWSSALVRGNWHPTPISLHYLNFSTIPIGCLLLSLFTNRSKKLNFLILFCHWLLTTWQLLLTPSPLLWPVWTLCERPTGLNVGASLYATSLRTIKRPSTVKFKISKFRMNEIQYLWFWQLQHLPSHSLYPLRAQSNSYIFLFPFVYYALTLAR
jgi:hypothetical protein